MGCKQTIDGLQNRRLVDYKQGNHSRIIQQYSRHSVGPMEEALDLDDSMESYMKEIIYHQVEQQILEGQLAPTDRSKSGAQQAASNKHKSLADQLKVGSAPFSSSDPLNYEDDIDYNYDQDMQGYPNRMEPSSFEIIEPDMYKIIGYTEEKGRLLPLYRMSDLYLTKNLRVQSVLSRHLDMKLKLFRPEGATEGPKATGIVAQSSFDNSKQLAELLDKWDEKMEDDLYNKKNMQNNIDEEGLQRIVVNQGDKKENFFLHYRGQSRPGEDVLSKKSIKNPLAHPNYLKRLHAAVRKLSMQYEVWQNPSDEDETNETNKKISPSIGDNNAVLNPSATFQNHIGTQLDRLSHQNGGLNSHWGNDHLSLNAGHSNNNFDTSNINSRNSTSSSNQEVPFGSIGAPKKRVKLHQPWGASIKPYVSVTPYSNLLKNHKESLQQTILRKHNYYNRFLLEETYKQPLHTHHRILLDLANDHYFNAKLHTVLDKNMILPNEGSTGFSRSNNNRSRLLPQHSLVSGSKAQSRHQRRVIGADGQTVSIVDRSQNGMLHQTEDDIDELEKFIESEIKNISKETLHHSEVANQFELVKFSLDQNVFASYHRFHFSFPEFLQGSVTVQVIGHKSRKAKSKDLVLNCELMATQNKFATKEALGMSSEDFILVEYIEETPLIMSNTGMCERLFIQVNYKDMLLKIQQDIVSSTDLDALEMRRDGRITKDSRDKSSFNRKCELWRRNVKEAFGDHGKLFLWEPKQPGKLIGSPDGLGVLVMESNLGAVPLVRKPPPQRDFLLVREGKRWMLRRIDHLYVSGQIEPNKKVFSPDSRDFLLFKAAYEKAFMNKQLNDHKYVTFQKIRNTFVGESESALRKILKSLPTINKDGKTYLQLEKPMDSSNSLTPQEVCLYERMQKSICELKEAGIKHLKNSEKIKNVLKEFNRRNCDCVKKFVVAKFVREQMQLTSWHLTESFLKFAKHKTSKIEVIGHADPTNGRGGYSYINKPQKERTCKEDLDAKEEKPKVSGTSYDLRKLRAEVSRQRLLELGYSEQDVAKKKRWDLVAMLRKQQGTQFTRKDKEDKAKKLQNEKKEISVIFNKMLAYLNEETPTPPFKYNFKKELTLQSLVERDKALWEKARDRINRNKAANIKSDDEQDDDDDDDDE